MPRNSRERSVSTPIFGKSASSSVARDTASFTARALHRGCFGRGSRKSLRGHAEHGAYVAPSYAMPLIESSHVILVHELAALGLCISLPNGRPLIVREPQWNRAPVSRCAAEFRQRMPTVPP